MKAVIVGSCGHYSYIWKGIEKYGIELVTVTEGVRCVSLTPKIYKTPEALLTAFDSGEIEADIAVINPEFHLNSIYAEKFLERGTHVFLEKPAATELEALERLRCVYRREKEKNPHLVLCPMFGMRAEPHFLKTKRMIAEGAIGSLRQLDVRKSYKMGLRPKFYSDRKSYGGLIPWVSIHGIDLLRWMTGEEFIRVSAWHSAVGNRDNGDMEVTSVSMFVMTGDIGAVVCADMLRPASAPTHDDDRLRAVGTDGVIEIAERNIKLIDNSGIRVFETTEQDKNGDLFSRMLEEIFCGKAPENAFDHASAEDMFAATEAALLARESADRGIQFTF